MRKSKEKIKRQLNESVINRKRHENKELQDKAEKFEKSNKTAKMICEFGYKKQ